MKRDQVNSVQEHALLKDAISIAPNPANGSFTINSTAISFRNAEVSIRMVTADGKTIVSTIGTFDTSGNLKVNIKDLPAGFYICEVSNKQGIARGRVVVY